MIFRYIERIFEYVRNIRLEEIKDFYDMIKDAELIIPYGSGRSYSSIKIAMGQLAKLYNSPKVITPEDTGFPGNTMYEALNILTKKYDKILLIINSGSGESYEPLNVAIDFIKYVNEHGLKDRLKLIAVTSNPNSSIGKLARNSGICVKLEAERPKSLDYTTTGIMGDIFELGSLMLFMSLVDMFYRDKLDYHGIIEEYSRNIMKYFDKYIDSHEYESTLDILERRSNVFIGGRGGSDEVATMLVIRLNHVKYAIGDHVYKARGSNTPRPRHGDLGIIISCSGETPAVLKWTEDLKNIGAYVFSIVGNPLSSLAKISDYPIILDSCKNYKPGTPRTFYMYASFLLSPLPIKLITRLMNRGLILPETLLRYYHSTME